jgi:transcriptional regulator with XRE-family HTH domain
MARGRLVISDFVAKVGARLRVLRYERGLSIRKLAELAECCVDSIVQIEMGRSSISTTTMQKLAQALKVEPFDLLNHDTQNDDLGYVIEKMRHDPEVLRFVSASIGRKQAKSGQRAGSSVPAEC